MMNPIARFSGKHRFLSNFWPAEVELDGLYYPTVEHAYQAAKTFDSFWRDIIRCAETPQEAKQTGRLAPLRHGWEEIRLEVMRGLVWQKFAHPDLRAKLLATGTAELIEGNTWGDIYWGVYGGVGENNLGRILMNIRERIRNQPQPEGN